VADVSQQVIGLVPVALAAGVLKKTLEEKPKTHWKYHPVFKDAYLDLWYEKSPITYNQAHEACNRDGDEMITWNKETNPELDRTIYGEAKKETRQAIMER